jgi:RsiW-degrading membrane proteinase PrsW (M82 family)
MTPAGVAHASIALAPVLLFLAALLQADSFKLLGLRTVLGLLAAGMAAAGAGYLANTAAFEHFAGGIEAYSRFVAPWIEEALKAAVLVVLIRSRRVGLPVDAGIAAFAIGTGFALVENLFYLLLRPDVTLPVQVIRGFGTAVMHGATSTVMAIVSVTLYDRRPRSGLALMLPGFLLAVALHSGFNFLLVRPALATLATVVAFPLVVYVVFRASERELRGWLDEDFDSTVQFLELLRSDAVLDGHKGRYLASLRDRFGGEDLADMLCLLQLHGELALRAKGILLMRECGFEEPPLDQATRAKLAEVAALKHSIGRTGWLAVRPLLESTGKDVWQLNLVRSSR